MIGLLDLLKTAGIELNLNSLKIHLACWNGREHPIDEYYAGRFQAWQEEQGRRNFECDQVLGLIDMGKSNWLFTGIYKVHGCKKLDTSFQYNTELLPGQNDLIGRIIVHHKRSRASYVWYKPEMAFPINEITRKKLSIEEFPGYNAVIISHSRLKLIIEQKIASWHGALANIKGIYLITDTSTGKHYVGKASGCDGIWQRWCSYAKSGHGGNEELKKILKENGSDHTNNFQYSILEILASDLDIIARELYWMNALQSREFGLN